MKTLLIMRHAKSSWSDSHLGDHDRPLNDRGKRDAPKMGRLLRDEELTPDLIISSSAVRALTTAEAVMIDSECEQQVIVERDLYHADSETYIEVVRQLGGDHEIVMVVGHNPGVEDLLDQLTGKWERMPTAALAEVQLDIEVWSDLTDEKEWELTNLWLPREIGD